MISRPFFSRQLVVTLALIPILMIAVAAFRFDKRTEFTTTQYQFTPSFFKFVSGGFWPAAVDGLWIQSIQLFGAANYSAEVLPRAVAFYRLGTDLDPDFYDLYEQGGVSFLFFFDHAESARQILTKGISAYETQVLPKRLWTHPVTLYIFLAYVYAFQLNDWKKAKALYLAAAEVKGAPPYLLQMRTWLAAENSERKLAIRTLKLLISKTDDPVIKNKYEEKLRQYE